MVRLHGGAQEVEHDNPLEAHRTGAPCNLVRSDGCHVQPLSGKKTKFKGSSLDSHGHIMHRRSEGMSERRNKGSYLQDPFVAQRQRHRFQTPDSGGSNPPIGTVDM